MGGATKVRKATAWSLGTVIAPGLAVVVVIVLLALALWLYWTEDRKDRDE